MNRREFIAGAGLLAAGLCGRKSEAAESPSCASSSVAPRNRTPYANVDWKSALQINTTSHGHCVNQQFLDAYLKRNFGFMTISNYYPSAPCWPAAKMTRNYYRVHHDFPVMVDGKRTDGPFDWNEIVSAWKDELPEKQRAELPFKEGGPLFPNWPKDLLEAPNAEHHGFLKADGSSCGAMHICSPGSTYASGTFDAHDFFKTVSRGKYDFGSGEFWQTAFKRMFDGLIVPDGGGVTINHPTWTNLSREFILELLDFDPRVLGIEVLENGRNSENYWDWVLSTGRQCYGFFVPDWGIRDEVFGVNVLLVPERTVEACLRAYRRGEFYGATHGLGELRFTDISWDAQAKTITASTDRPAKFEVITSRGVVETATGTSVRWTVPKPAMGWGPRCDRYARIRATAADGCGEVLYSQATMLY